MIQSPYWIPRISRTFWELELRFKGGPSTHFHLSPLTDRRVYIPECRPNQRNRRTPFLQVKHIILNIFTDDRLCESENDHNVFKLKREFCIFFFSCTKLTVYHFATRVQIRATSKSNSERHLFSTSNRCYEQGNLDPVIVISVIGDWFGTR